MASSKLIFVAVLGFVMGSFMLVSWIARLRVSGSPIVNGHVTSRTEISEWGVPRVDFSIQLDDSPVIVHSHAQRYLIDKVPANVRFHYSGDPSELVYLFDHEENPLWIWLFCWFVSAVLGAILYHRRKLARQLVPVSS